MEVPTKASQGVIVSRKELNSQMDALQLLFRKLIILLGLSYVLIGTIRNCVLMHIIRITTDFRI